MTRTALTATAARAVIIGTCQLAANRPVTSAIICDRRLTAQHSLSVMLRPLRPLIEITCVGDGFELVDAYSARPVDIVLIGIERSCNAGPEAIGLQLAMHPRSVIITVGAVADVDLLVAATVRGSRGLLVWDPDQPPPDGPLVW